MLINNPVITGSFTVNGTNFITNTPSTGSNTFNGNQTISGSAIVTGSLQVTGSISTTGTITAQTLVVQTITSSVDYITGSSINGSLMTNTHQVTGSLLVTGSIVQTGANAINLFSGSVGINTTSPSYTLDVSGSGNISGALTAASFNGLTYVNSGAYLLTTGATKIQLNQAELLSSAGASNRAWAFGLNSSVAGDFVLMQGSTATGGTYTTKLALSSTGMVSINGLAYSTNYKFGVTGSAYVNGANSKGIFITDQASYASIVGINSAISAYNNLEIRASGTDGQLFLSTGGNISMGSTTDAGFRLYVKQTTGGIYVEAGSTSSHKALQCNSADGGTIFFFVRGDGLINTGLTTYSPYNFSLTGRACYINSSGELGYLSSTRESKTNISSVTDVNWINQLNPVSFNYRKKDDEMNYTEEHYEDKSFGLIADEVEKVNPDFVFYDIKKDGTKKLAGVKYESMTAVLIKAIQEQQAQIEVLKTEIEILKNK